MTELPGAGQRQRARYTDRFSNDPRGRLLPTGGALPGLGIADCGCGVAAWRGDGSRTRRILPCVAVTLLAEKAERELLASMPINIRRIG